jgi:hypothetical protein
MNFIFFLDILQVIKPSVHCGGPADTIIGVEEHQVK